jgi:GrpB-like predicted nucleotidyltransferase (UPF0157 family)
LEPLILCEYDGSWPERFAALAERQRAALGAIVLAVEHVGSTAVPGLAAKPIIDLDVVIRRGHVPEAISCLGKRGYVHEGDLGVAGREAFRGPPEHPSHHLYVLEEGAAELARHVAFREALRASADLRNRYASLKRSLAVRHAEDRAAYWSGKCRFIQAVLEGAQDSL